MFRCIFSGFTDIFDNGFYVSSAMFICFFEFSFLRIDACASFWIFIGLCCFFLFFFKFSAFL